MIKVKNYRGVNFKDSQTVAYVDFYNTETTQHLNDCKLIRRRDGGFFISYPSKKVEKEGEETYYVPYFCYEGERNEHFQKAALKAIDAWVAENKGKDEEEISPF